MSKNLIIVESPEKARTIEKFLGGDYHVVASKGHIRDIEGSGKNSIGIDFEHGYKPNYVLDSSKVRLLNTLQQEIKKADKVWLASDEDREGEAIAWHLLDVLGLDEKEDNRIVFHEITKTAIQEALLHPRKIDYNLVNAQQARRVLDRIVGFELSPVLWKKIGAGLSAGRVQSVAVRLIVEREREIEQFQQTAHYRILADFIEKNATDTNAVLHTELNHRFNTKDEVLAFLNECKTAAFSVNQILCKPAKRVPAPPFTTSSLQQEAARKLKFSVSKTMRIAQSLYESGHITYMRTDSFNLSSLAIATAKKEIISLFGEKYHNARNYRTTAKGAQEAHEAIRPTYMNVRSAGVTNDEKRLYELIWKRTIACQMADAELETTHIEVTADNMEYAFVATGENVVFDGFMKVYVQSTDDEQSEENTLLPRMKEHAPLNLCEAVGKETFTRPPFRFTEASLVKRMEELGIGRPSTYATIIETIQSRHYVERGNMAGKERTYNILTLKNGKLTEKNKNETYGQDSQKLLPTDLGRMTNDFLVEHFPNILSYDFTAKEENNFDQIAEGKADWVKTVDAFYKAFHPEITKVPSGRMAGRLLGTDPETGAPVQVKISKVGPCVQIGNADNGKPRFVSLPKDKSVFTITLEEALQLFKQAQPSVLFQIDGKDVVTGKGKYGPYIHYDGQYISVPKNYNPNALTEADVQAIIRDHTQKVKPLMEFGNICVMEGRYGTYIKTPEGNYRIPKNVKLSNLTEEECQTIIANNKTPKKNVRRNS